MERKSSAMPPSEGVASIEDVEDAVATLTEQDTSAAAIDRVVHHSVILELNVSSYRMEAAKKRTQKEAK